MPEPLFVADVVIKRFREAEVAHLGNVALCAGYENVSGSLKLISGKKLTSGRKYGSSAKS